MLKCLKIKLKHFIDVYLRMFQIIMWHALYLLAAIRVPLGQASGSDDVCAKRPCIRQLVGVGEQAEDSGERAKGTSNVIVDLGGEHTTRTKTDISQREKALYFVFRAMDHQKQDHCITPTLRCNQRNTAT